MPFCDKADSQSALQSSEQKKLIRATAVREDGLGTLNGLAIKMKSSKSTTEGGKPPPKDIRDKEIEFQRWVQEGGDPNEFNWGK
jgi:hypothetical protein